jgi:hypothetical protein
MHSSLRFIEKNPCRLQARPVTKKHLLKNGFYKKIVTYTARVSQKSESEICLKQHHASVAAILH